MASKTPSDSDLLAIVDKAWDEAWDIINTEDGWKEEKKGDGGEVVMSRKKKNGKKIYRIKVIVDVEAKKLVDALENTEKLTDWNDTLTKHEILKVVNDKVKISYQITTEAGPGGMVSARDFIFIYKSDFKGDAFVQGGCSVEYPGPKSSKIVRAWNGPGAQVVRPISDPSKCEFIWLMDCEYRGWIPGSIIEIAMPMAQLQFVKCIKDLAKKL